MIITKYQNGNCAVTISSDGTKTREWPDGATPNPVFPESIDLKITNYCNSNCEWCHESSSTNGKHAPIERFEKLSVLPRGVEIAIGGGNPLSHSQLENILEYFKSLGLISNITINAVHLLNQDRISLLQTSGLITAAGISGLLRNEFKGPNIVHHFIVGIDSPFDVFDSIRNKVKILLLGYKQYGRGEHYYSKWIDNNIKWWKYYLQEILQHNAIISFDNLALEQLNIKQLIGEKIWVKHYMGNDGEFTMYYDAVKNEYAKSSTDTRYDGRDLNIIEMFQQLKKK